MVSCSPLIVMDRHLRSGRYLSTTSRQAAEQACYWACYSVPGRPARLWFLRRGLSASTYAKANLQSCVDMGSACAHGGSRYITR